MGKVENTLNDRSPLLSPTNDPSNPTDCAPDGRPRTASTLSNISTRSLKRKAPPIKSLKAFQDWFAIKVAICLTVVYLAVGSVYYGYDKNSIAGLEEAGFADGFYFAVVTLTTVGYGDLQPTDESRAFTAVYVLVGVTLIGYCVGLFVAFIDQREHARLERMREKAKLSEFQPLPNGPESSRSGLTVFWSSRSDLFKALFRSFIAIVITLMLGVALLMFDGGPDGSASFIDAFYFASVTATTVGYGDMTPQTKWGKIVCALYIFVTSAVFAQALSTIASIPLQRRRQRLEEEVLRQYGTILSKTEYMDLCQGGDGDGQCTRNEFILRMLVKLDRIEVSDIASCGKRFDDLDLDGDGVLTVKDVRDHWGAVSKLSKTMRRLRTLPKAPLKVASEEC